MPDQYFYVITRYIVSLQVLLYSLLSTYTLTRFPPFAKLSRQQFTFAVIAFFVSITPFTPFPWHTIDGVMFAAVAVYLLVTGEKTLTTVLAGLAIVLSMATKQSFYPLAIVFPMALFISAQYRKGFVLLTSLCSFLALSLILLKVSGLLPEFVLQTTGAATLSDAYESGIRIYFKSPLNIGLLWFVFSRIGRYIAQKRKLSYSGFYDVFALIVLVVIFAWVRGLLKMSGISRMDLGVDHLLFAFALIYGVLCLRKGVSLRNLMPYALLLAIAWCSGVSWGFQSPAYLAAPLIMGAYTFFLNGNSRRPLQTGVKTLMITSILAYCLMVSLVPYRDARRSELDCELGSIEPRLSLIVTTQQNCKKIQEAQLILKSLEGYKVAFLPSFGIVYHLNARSNPLSSNWTLDAEVGRSSGRLEREMTRAVQFVVVDRKSAAEVPSGKSKYSQPLLTLIEKDWISQYDGDQFTVLLNPIYKSLCGANGEICPVAQLSQKKSIFR
ncbi:MAG: hypothetical protein EOP10_28555 [Proteobacteria bacterium]|nr:MAG: hypothetical protein EOP10_28555 [Pseudomonadota bacterium]